MNTFNFFKILEKDNKELIHSAFISYLIDTNENFKFNFLGLVPGTYAASLLEKTYIEKKTSKKKLRTRIDIEVSSLDGSSIIFIENKFKSFPNKTQLDHYNTVFKYYVSKSTNCKKILFCFDKDLLFFETDWNTFDYKELLAFLAEEFNFSKTDDETSFVRHYHDFLADYVNNYKNYKAECAVLFRKGISNEEKFWLRLLNSQIQLYFSKIFDIQNFELLSNPGNTSTPLLNIVPYKWKEVTGHEVLIQFQGNDLKFYIHSRDKEAIQKMIDYSSVKLWNDKIELKKLSKRDSKSCFILKIKVREMLGDSFSINDLCNLIYDFYENIDKNIIDNYKMQIKN